uniref:SET domain-containing protein n=1 Tax=Chlorocebus sabaeus TaxID=60711 RepID=A0A0D9QZV4_CHLSB
HGGGAAAGGLVTAAPAVTAAVAARARARGVAEGQAGLRAERSPSSARWRRQWQRRRGLEMVEWRDPRSPRTEGENVFTGRSKIYSYMSPNRCSGMRSPLPEENSVTHHRVKCQGPLARISRKREEKGKAIRSTRKSEEQKIKHAGEVPWHLFQTNSEAAEPPKTQTSLCDSTNAAIAKQAPKKPFKGTQQTPKKDQGKTQQTRKFSGFYPVRSSSRKSKGELQSEERKIPDDLIEDGKKEGMKIDLIDGKGRDAIAVNQFSQSAFVTGPHQDRDAKMQAAFYAQDPPRCYLYCFQYLSKTCATTIDTNRLGRLINHSQCGNCQTKLQDIDSYLTVILKASGDSEA